MKKTINAFIIKCNNCGKGFEDCSGFSVFVDEEDAHPEDSDWHVDEDIHYCPKCYSVDDDDKVFVIKQNKHE